MGDGLTFMDEGELAETHNLKRISPLWSLVWIALIPLAFPPALIFYAGVAFGGPMAKAGFLLLILSTWYVMDRDTRGRINDNIARVRSALVARASAAAGPEPAALLLHSFRNQSAYRDESFSLYERVDPAVRAIGFRPLAFGTALPLAPEHGVALITTPDEAWWDAFRLAAEHAAVIFASPEGTLSLRRELSWLAEKGHTGKLVVLMAPEPLDVARETGDPATNFSEPGGPREGRITGWNEAQRIWREEMGIDLPDYDPRGALIVLSDRGDVAWTRPLRKFAKEAPFSKLARFALGGITGNYNTGAGVDLHPLLCEALIQRQWAGPPVSELWRRLSPPPLDIGPRPRFHPPGASGPEVGQQFLMLAFIGWGLVLIVSCLGAIF